jgi:hypothetical protein
VVGATTIMLSFYALDFVWARSLYGIAAAVHAYLEFPILLLAIMPMHKRERLAYPILPMPS